MICRNCNSEMSLEESDYDNVYIQTEHWFCEKCESTCDGTSWGMSGEWEYNWEDNTKINEQAMSKLVDIILERFKIMLSGESAKYGKSVSDNKGK